MIRWFIGHVYRDRTGAEYVLEGERRETMRTEGGLAFAHLSKHSPPWTVTRRASGRCVDDKESDGDILPEPIREFGTTPDDRKLLRTYGG